MKVSTIIRQNEKYLEGLKNFMPICPNESIGNLTVEILKTSIQIERLKNNGYDELQKDVLTYYITEESKLNFSN